MSDYPVLIAWLTEAFREAGITNPTPEGILQVLLEDKLIAEIWVDVYGMDSPIALPEKEQAKLITELTSTISYSFDRSHGIRVISREHKKAKKNRARERSKECYRNRKHDRKESRRKQALDFIENNPRKYGNGKYDETYPEYYLCFQKRGER